MSELDINVTAYIKGNDRYIFIYEDHQEKECLSTFGRFAANPELNFNWYDAAVMSQKIRHGTTIQLRMP